jgi:hypothetical protein
VTQAEEELRQGRIEAKDAGVYDPNSWDQEFGFLSVEYERPKPEAKKWLSDNCDRKRILEWQDAPEQPRKLQFSEFAFATSGAGVDTWESTSTRGGSSKRRKIDENDYAWVNNTKASGDSERWRERQPSHNSERRPRARSEVVRRRKPVADDHLGYQFEFVWPPVETTVSTVTAGKENCLLTVS